MNPFPHPVLLAASTAPSPLWYATRAGGTVALVLLTATVALGIAVGGRHEPRAIARFEVTTLHRNLAVLTLVFLVLHIVTAILETFVNLGWWITLVPFTSGYRTLWLGLGTVAFDLLLAVTITSATSRIRLRMGQRRWKAVHWLAHGSFPVAVFHAAGTGTDTKDSPQLLLYAVCLGVVRRTEAAGGLGCGREPGWERLSRGAQGVVSGAAVQVPPGWRSPAVAEVRQVRARTKGLLRRGAGAASARSWRPVRAV